MSSEIFEWLITRPAFKQQYSALIKESVALQFNQFQTIESSEALDWNYLLKCASFLGQSTSVFMQDAALRIAQHCIQQSSRVTTDQLNSAQFVLDALANRQAIKLAIDKGLITKENTYPKHSFVANINWVRNEIKHSIWLSGGHRLDVNNFQASFWNALGNYQNLSISAPTAAGKSFLVKQWIADQVATHPNLVVAYIVPTRALIAEIELDFQKEFTDRIRNSSINITSFPFTRFAHEGKTCIYILTQERLQLLLAQGIQHIDILVIDEAYKLADGDRGILLQHVIEKSVLAFPTAKVVYISPQVDNPELLVEPVPTSFSKRYEDVTVNQNLLWATQNRGKKWDLEVCHANGNISLGEFELPANPSPTSLKLPMVAFTLGQSGGNIIYVNGAADAEKASQQICDLIGLDNPINEPKIDDLIELCKKVIHDEYRLAEVLKYGVAFHYGNIPVLIKEEIETLFKEGLIKYLICTSTLVEGVNLPCKNIFIRAPKRGNNNPMTPADFWNLAGRAGRWGKDFQGNIVCVDPTMWDAPRQKTLMSIIRATDETLERQPSLIKFIQDGTPRDIAVSEKNLESMTSYLAISHLIFNNLSRVKWLKKIEKDRLEELESVVVSMLNSCANVPNEIIINHPGISPLAMHKLLEHFLSGKEMLEALFAPYATDTDAVAKYVVLFKRLHNTLTNEFGDRDAHIFRQAIVTVHWMQGRSINRIISERKRAVPTEEIHSTIRTVLSDIESVARYKAPKFLSCYNDLLKHFYIISNRKDLADEIEDITLFLEMGVNTKTQLSLLNLGLSRTSAVELKTYITADDLSESDCLNWFASPNNNWKSRDLPKIVKREVERMLTIHNS